MGCHNCNVRLAAEYYKIVVKQIEMETTFYLCSPKCLEEQANKIHKQNKET